MNADFQKEAFAQVTKIQLVFLTIVFVGFAADVSLDKSSLDLAREQLASIKDATLKWNENWLTEAAGKKVQWVEHAPPQGFKFTFEPNSQLGIVELPPRALQIRPLPNALDVLSHGYGTPTASVMEPAIAAPKSLSEFWNVWDALREKISIYTEFEPIDIPPVAHGISGKTFSKVSSILPGDPSLQAAYRHTGSLRQIHPSDQEFFKKFAPTHRVIAKWPDGPGRIYIFLKSRSKLNLDGQEALIAQHGSKWHLGAANDVFKDLHSISANFADLPLEKIGLILESEAKRYGERLSLLGVSLPTGQLAVWSLLLVTIVYLYFLIILRGLARHSQKESEILVYPWIGVLPGRVPLFAALASLCLFPAAFGVAKCFAIYRLANSTMSLRIGLTAAAVVLVSSTIVVAITILELRRMQK